MSDNAHPETEKRVPYSVVFISLGSIILLAAAAIWWMDTTLNIAQLGLLETAVPLPTQQPTPILPTPSPQDESQVALLPETPLEANYPAHFVSAIEAAQPNNGQPVQIIIPQIDVDAPVSAIGLQSFEAGDSTYFQWMVPSDYKAGWHNTSARLGEAGNTVLNGHHNIHGEIFRDLDLLEEGDEIILHDPNQSFTYKVTQKLILEERDQPIEIRQENAKWIEPTDDERLTIITCWPYTDNSHRVIVVAYPENNQIEEVTDE